MVPMCISTCPCRANYFGDPEDKESLLYKIMKKNKVKVLQAVTPKVEAKISSGMFKGMNPEAIAKKIGYPGKAPVFADSAVTKPRVYYVVS
jgi:Fe-S-cluster-containing dehydrogenase component